MNRLGEAGADPTALTAALFTLALVMLALVGLALLSLRVARRRRELATELHAARTQSQALADVLEVWTWHTDAAHRLVALRPPQGAAPADWSGHALEQPIWEHFGPDDEAALRAQLASGAPLDDIQVRLGESRRAALRARAVTDPLGRFAGYHGTLRELPATAAPATATVQPTAAAAPSAPPLATVGDDHDSFSFTVSHDLRAPIRVVEGFTKIVKEDYGRLLDRVANDHLDRVLGAAARMNLMIDALLTLARLSTQPLTRQPVNLSQLAAYVADELRRGAPEREADIEIEPGLTAQGDPTLLRLVLENLLGNAWKYSARCARARITLSAVPHEGGVAYVVRDNGAGFDMRASDRLFGLFQRLHSASEYPGTGVGLASVKRIVQRHGGDIWAEAEPGRGAAFTFTLAG